MHDTPALQAEFSIAELYEMYEAGLQRYSKYLSADADWAEDLVSETMIKAMTNLTILSAMHPAQRKAWLHRVLKNQFLDDLRARKREENLLEKLAALDQEFAPQDLRSEVSAPIPANHRQVLHLRYTQGMSSEEIGQSLGIPSSTARSRLRLALQWIKNHLNP